MCQAVVTACRKEIREMVQRLWVRRDGQRQESGRKLDEGSRNPLDAMSEYDQRVLQNNSTQTSLTILWPSLRRLGPLQVVQVLQEVFENMRLQPICAQGSGKHIIYIRNS